MTASSTAAQAAASPTRVQMHDGRDDVERLELRENRLRLIEGRDDAEVQHAPTLT